MAGHSPQGRHNLSDSSMTIPSDSENYDANHELSSSPPSSSGSPLILYSPPTLWGLIRGAAINLLLPFINGLMLGFGELIAHEVAFRFGWSGTKVCWGTRYHALMNCFVNCGMHNRRFQYGVIDWLYSVCRISKLCCTGAQF